MPSLAELLGLAPAVAPWNSNLTFPSSSGDESATPWWLQSVSPQSIAPLVNPTLPNVAPFAAPDAASGGWLGDVLTANEATTSPRSGGILQGAVPDMGQDAPSAAVLSSLLGLPRTGSGVADWSNRFVPSRSPTLSQSSGAPIEASQSSTRFQDFNRSNAPLFLPQVSVDPWGAPIFVRSGAVHPPTVPLAQSIPTRTPELGAQGANGLDVASPSQSEARPLSVTPSLGTGAVFGEATSDSGGVSVDAEPNRGPSADRISAEAPNVPLATVYDSDNSSEQNDKAADPALAVKDDQAKASIASDAELRTTAQMAEAAGDKSYKDRIGAIIAQLEYDPAAARDALWREVFAAGLRSSQIPSLAAAVAREATLRAAKRLDALYPGLGLDWAVTDATEQLREYNDDQRRTFYRIIATPGLAAKERWKRFGEAGLIDAANASLADPQHLPNLLGGGLFATGGLIAGLGARRGPGFSYRGGLDVQTPELLQGAELVRRGRSQAERRYQPGVVTGVGVELDGPWLMGKREAPIPRQVADLLRGRSFSTYADFREEFWRTVASVPELAAEFGPQNLALMRKGNAPNTIKLERRGQQRVFHTHHVQEIQHGGEVYNLDNLRVVTPLRHGEMHRGH